MPPPQKKRLRCAFFVGRPPLDAPRLSGASTIFSAAVGSLVAMTPGSLPFLPYRANRPLTRRTISVRCRTRLSRPMNQRIDAMAQPFRLRTVDTGKRRSPRAQDGWLRSRTAATKPRPLSKSSRRVRQRHFVASLRNATKSSRSLSFFKPTKVILVPVM